MTNQRNSYPPSVPHGHSPHANGGYDHHMMNSDHPSFRYPVPDKSRRSEYPMIERPISLDPLFIKVLHKIFPQLSTELISRELATCANDLTKTVEFMLRKYQSALEDVPFHSIVPTTVAEQTYSRQSFMHPAQSPRSYSRESSPASGKSGYSPGPPQLYTPVVYPSDAKYEQKVYNVHYQTEAEHRFDRRCRDEMRDESMHQHSTQYQNGVLSYEEALHISQVKNKENAMKVRKQHTLNGQSYSSLSEDSEEENQEQNVTSSNGNLSRTVVTPHDQE